MQTNWGKLSPGCQVELLLALIVVVPFCIFISCGLAWVVAIELEAQGYVPYIQQALDEQCGVGVVTASAEGFNGDLAPSSPHV